MEESKTSVRKLHNGADQKLLGIVNKRVVERFGLKNPDGNASFSSENKLKHIVQKSIIVVN
jgi:hypothetical protein